MGKHNKRSSKINKNQLILLSVLAVVLLGLLVAVFVLKDSAQDPPVPTLQTSATQNHPSTGETDPTDIQTQPTIVLEQRVEGSYEQWLAAAGMYGVTMQYPEGLPVGIYAPANTLFENRSQSSGVYIRVQMPDTELLVHCKPLDAERTEKGTVDLYTKELGYNTFDEIPLSGVELSAMEELKFEDLIPYMDQTLLATVLEH